MEEFKVVAEGHAQNLQNSVLAIKYKTDQVRNELVTIQSIFDGIRSLNVSMSSIKDDPYAQTSASQPRSRFNPTLSRYGNSDLNSKLEKYKKTADERKSQNRSTSKNIPGKGQGDNHNSKALTDKISMLESCFNELCLAFDSREKEFECLKEIIEDNENDQFAFIYQTEEAFKMIQNRINKEDLNYSGDLRNEMQRHGYDSFGHEKLMENAANYNSNPYGQKYNRRDLSPELSPSADAIRMQDLQRTNELLLKELRTANDKYFNERLEGKKYKEELKNLKKELSSIKKDSSSKVVTSKRNLNDVCKENDSLRDKIKQLEQEYNSLIYYKETILSKGNNVFSIDNFDPEMRKANVESDGLRNKLETTTIYVKKFLLAMKRLQRGIKNKDPNSKSMKIEFEKSKKELEDWWNNLKDEFLQNRSQSRSKERTFSPAGINSQSRSFSPYSPSPGTITPKEKLKPKQKGKSQNRVTPESSKVKKDTRGQTKPKPVSKNAKYSSNEMSANISYEVDNSIRQPDFNSKSNVNMFGEEEKNVAGEQVNLSRTTFGISGQKVSSVPPTEFIPISEYENLKKTLTQLIEDKDNELRLRLNEIIDDLNMKTSALNKMKRTLVTRLKEIEESLIETNKEYQKSLEVDAMMESSREERGESQLAELMEQKRNYEKQLVVSKEQNDILTRDNQDLQLELKKYKRDYENLNKMSEEFNSKLNALNLEIQIKNLETTELLKLKESLSKDISTLQTKMFEREEAYKLEKQETKKEHDTQIFKLQKAESQHIKDMLELNEKIKKKDKDLALKASEIDDYKSKEKQYLEKINNQSIQIKSLSISHINTGGEEEVDETSYANAADDEDSSIDQRKDAEIRELIANNPKKATEDLYRLWRATSKEFNILKKSKTQLEDQFEEFKDYIDESRQEERKTVEEMINYRVKILELEKENSEIKKLVGTKSDEASEESISKYNEEISKLNSKNDNLSK